MLHLGVKSSLPLRLVCCSSIPLQMHIYYNISVCLWTSLCLNYHIHNLFCIIIGLIIVNYANFNMLKEGPKHLNLWNKKRPRQQLYLLCRCSNSVPLGAYSKTTILVKGLSSSQYPIRFTKFLWFTLDSW